MNKYTFFFSIIAVLFCLFGFGQDTLVFFDKHYPKANKIEKFPDYWLGNYKDESGIKWEINEKSISTVSNLYLSLTKEEIKKDKKLELKGTYLFGFIEGDSVQTLVRNDTVFFGYSNKKEIVNLSTKNILVTKVESQIFIYSWNDIYEGMVLTKLFLDKEKLKVYYQDNDLILPKLTDFKKWKFHENENQFSVMIKNNKKTFSLLIDAAYFDFALELTFQND